jgi:WD40 repeat protein
VTSMRPREGGVLSHPGARVLLASTGSHAPGSKLPPVPSAGSSVMDLGRRLVERAGLDPDHLTMAVDAASPQDLADVLTETAERAPDVFLFWYVGHGLVNVGNELHLATRATIDLTRGVPAYQALPYSTVKEIIKQCRAEHVLIVLDCCFSGRADGWIPVNGDNPFNSVRQQGVYVLASAGRDEEAWAPPGRYTAFTGEIIRLLAEGDPTAPYQLTFDSIYRCLTRTMPKLGLPRPHRYVADESDPVLLAANPAYQPPSQVPAGTPSPEPGFSPYPGLAPFEPEDAKFFFGRDDLTRTVVELLGERLSRNCPLVVTGPSGSGKSSLLRAGLIPALRQMREPIPGRSRPPYSFLTPGTDPVRNLAKCVATGSRTATEKLVDQVIADPSSFAAAVDQAALAEAAGQGLESGPAVIVVDQFEEVFAPDINEDQRSAFVNALCAACRRQDKSEPSTLVVIGVRADFFGHCAAYAQLVPALERPVVVGPMSEDQLRTVITRPAEASGLVLEEGLEDLLIHDVRATSRSADGSSGTLPLLAHALLVTWQQRRGSLLTLAGYRASGGIAGSLTQTAEETLRQLDLGSQQIARRLLPRLVQLGEGTEDTRRYARLSDLLPPHDALDRAAASHVLEVFARARLLTIDTDTVEITHEALIREWPRFRDWISADRTKLLAHQQLSQDAAAWDRSGREPAYLYSGSRLTTAQATAEEYRPELIPLEQAFLEASLRRSRRRTTRTRQLIATLIALLMFAVAAGIGAFQQRLSADHARNLALSRLVAAETAQLGSTDPALAMQLSVAAYRLAHTTQAFAGLIEATGQPAATRILGPAGTELHAVAFSPDATTLATASANTTVRMWSIRPGKPAVPIGPPMTGLSGGATSVAFSPNHKILAAGSTGGAVCLWNIDHPRRPLLLRRIVAGSGDSVNSIAFSANGRLLASASSNGRVRLWHVTGPGTLAPLGLPLNPGVGSVNAVVFSRTGEFLAAGGNNGHIRLWHLHQDRASDQDSELLTGPIHPVNAVAISPNGKTLAAGSTDDKVWLWNISNRRRPVLEWPPLTGPASWIYSVAFSPDGQTIAAGSADDSAYVWEIATKALVATLPHPGPVLSVTYGRDSHTLATGDADGVARLWTLPGPVLTGFKRSVFTVAFSEDGHHLVSASGDGLLHISDVANPMRPIPVGPPFTAPALDGTVAYGPGGRIAAGDANGSIQLWNARNPAHPVRIHTPPSALKSAIQYVSFDHSGHFMAAGDSTGNIELWNVTDFANTSPITILPDHSAAADHQTLAVVFSPNDRLLAAANSDGTVRLWNINGRGNLQQLGPPLTRLNSAVYQVTFSPDGRTLAAAGEDGKVRLWDVTNPSQPHMLSTLSGPEGIVYDVSFSPDGHNLVTANGDRTVSLWDITNPAHPHSLGYLTGPSGTVFSATISPSGEVIAAGGQDDTVRLWLATPEVATKYICSVTGARITPAEWSRYIPGTPYNPPC